MFFSPYSTLIIILNNFLSYDQTKNIHVCLQCGCVFSIQAIEHEARCPVCKGKDFDRIEGFEG